MFDSVLLAAAMMTSDYSPNAAPTAAIIQRAAQPPNGWEAFAECVEQRESNGRPNAVNRSSGAAGLFQFMPAWRHGLPYVVAERLRQFGMNGKQASKIRMSLSSKRIQVWPGIYQRIGFAEVLEDGLWQHWTLPGSRCQTLHP